MDLAQLTNQPIFIDVAGKQYPFAEIPIDGIGRLQAWLKENHPHPLRALAGQLDGFSEEEKAELLRQARQDALKWPPQVGTTASGTAALLGTEEGQIRALYESLKVHQAGATLADARRIYKQLTIETARWVRRRGADPEGKISRIFRIAFGMDDLEGDPGDDVDPKGLPIRAMSQATGSNGD